MNRKIFALSYGLAVHGLFLLAVVLMMTSFFGGFPLAQGTLQGSARTVANMGLLLQFPLFHSLLLTARGRKTLACPFEEHTGRTLSTTSYAAISSLQLILALLHWSPSNEVWLHPTGALLWVWSAAYGASWLLLMKAMSDAGLAVQLGYLGWVSLYRGEKPRFGSFSTSGTCGLCRHPIYMTFVLILWLGPIWTPDHLLVASVWTTYCLLGPLLKERRYLQFYGERYREYQRRTPFGIPFRITSEAPDSAEVSV